MRMNRCRRLPEDLPMTRPSIADIYPGRYIRIQTNTKGDTILIHTDEEISNENLEPEIRRLNRNVNKPIDFVVYHEQNFLR